MHYIMCKTQMFIHALSSSEAIFKNHMSKQDVKDYLNIWHSHRLPTLSPGFAPWLLIGRYNAIGLVVNDAGGALAQRGSNWTVQQQQ